MPAGSLRKRLTFETEGETPDGGGGYVAGWSTIATVWGSFRPERGRERLEAGRLEGAVAGVVRVRSSATTRTITEKDRVTFGGDSYQIRSLTNPDQRNKFLEFLVEKGVAV